MEKKDSKFKRQIAFKVRIKDLVNGRYVKEEGWEPNYIITKQEKKISRINLIGIIVAKNDDINTNYEGVILEDGSGKISIREFKENKVLKNVEIGNIVMVIGRPREYGTEKYIVPEIVKKIENEKWVALRKIELEIENSKEEKEEVQEEIIEEKEMPLSQKIYTWIKEKDSGEGIEISELIKKHGDGSEKIIKRFLVEGEIFEIKPGRIKVLE